MTDVTDYGLMLTEAAGALAALAFVRAVVLYGRARPRPAPVVAPVRIPASLRPLRSPAPNEPASAPPATEPLPLASVILGTKSMSVEEAADGRRFFVWSLTRFRHHRAGET
jgi:hypothetical protein